MREFVSINIFSKIKRSSLVFEKNKYMDYQYIYYKKDLLYVAGVLIEKG